MIVTLVAALPRLTLSGNIDGIRRAVKLSLLSRTSSFMSGMKKFIGRTKCEGPSVMVTVEGVISVKSLFTKIERKIEMFYS